MELANSLYPMRSVIRCKAKQRLTVNVDGSAAVAFDESLFQDLASTLFSSGQYQAVHQPYASKAEACAVEDWVAMELATTYQRVTQNQQNPIVQQLNALL